MRVTIKKGLTGVFFATSEDEPTFFVSAIDSDDLIQAVTAALEDFYLSQHHADVRAIPLDGGNDQTKPWAIVPASQLTRLARTDRAGT